MKALQVEQQARPARAGPRCASAVGAGGGGEGRAARARHVDRPAELPGAGWHRVHTRLAGHLRQRPVDGRGPRVDVLRRLGQLPVRARPRGRRPSSTTARRVVIEPVLGHAARGFAPPFAGRRARRRRRLRPPRHRPPRARHPDRLLLLDRRRLGAGFVAHDGQLHDVADDDDRRAGGARSSRSPAASTPRCSPAASPSARRRPIRSSPCSAPARWASPPIAGLRRYVPQRAHRRRRPLPAPAAPRPRSSAPTTSSPPTSCPAPCAGIVGCHVVGDHLSSGAHATIDAVGNAASIAAVPAHHPAPRPRRADGHAGRGHRRPHRAVAPRDRARRRLHLRHRDAARRHAASARSTSPSRPPPPSRPSAGSPPRTASPTTTTPSPTPPRPAAAAPIEDRLRPRRAHRPRSRLHEH